MDPVIIIAALASKELEREAKQMGVGYLIKPIDREEFISKIEDVLRVVNL